MAQQTPTKQTPTETEIDERKISCILDWSPTGVKQMLKQMTGNNAIGGVCWAMNIIINCIIIIIEVIVSINHSVITTTIVIIKSWMFMVIIIKARAPRVNAEATSPRRGNNM